MLHVIRKSNENDEYHIWVDVCTDIFGGGVVAVVVVGTVCG